VGPRSSLVLIRGIWTYNSSIGTPGSPFRCCELAAVIVTAVGFFCNEGTLDQLGVTGNGRQFRVICLAEN
jgi:hypothetical protein